MKSIVASLVERWYNSRYELVSMASGADVWSADSKILRLQSQGDNALELPMRLREMESM